MRPGVRCLLVVAVVFWAVPAVAAPPLRIVCLGDSVTKAVRQGVTEEQTFCSQLQRLLSSNARPVEVINAGIGGNTTAHALARFERDVLDRDPNIVVLMFGLNDSWIDEGKTASRISVAEYRENLLQMIVMLGDLDVPVVLMTPNPALAPKYDPQRNRTLRPYVEAVRALAREQQLKLVDLYAHFGELGLEGAELNGLFTDAMHPNPAGQKLIAELLEPKLRSLLHSP